MSREYVCVCVCVCVCSNVLVRLSFSKQGYFFNALLYMSFFNARLFVCVCVCVAMSWCV